MFICLSLLFAFTLFLSVFSSKLRNAASLGIGLTFCMGFLIIGNKEYLGGETLPDLQMYKEFFLQKENIDNIELSWSFLKTLSKILCKWKQDSAVSLFLYLDSVFKNKHKLIHNQAPVMNRLCPFLLNLHK